MSDEERSASEHRSLMADLRAAVESGDVMQVSTADCAKLLALLEAGRACRDWAEQLSADTLEPRAPECVRAYDEAAK